MPKDKMTPEERLLKIIENPDTQKRALPLSATVKTMGLGLKSARDWISNFHFDVKSLKQLNLRMVNIMVAASCALITVIWLFDFTRTGVNLSRRFKKISSGALVPSVEEGKEPRIDISLDEAASEVRKRNIFTFLPTKEEVASTVSIGPVLSNFKLVGVLWSDNPQAMIENIKEQKTYFVAAGDRIGEVEVRKILRDKVIMGKDDQEFELR